jgi:hypothetical protein
MPIQQQLDNKAEQQRKEMEALLNRAMEDQEEKPKETDTEEE